jgi:hypothetical protein
VVPRQNERRKRGLKSKELLKLAEAFNLAGVLAELLED